MIAFDHAHPGRTDRDHSPPLLAEALLAVCGIALLPFTLLLFLGWGAARLARW